MRRREERRSQLIKRKKAKELISLLTGSHTNHSLNGSNFPISLLLT
jgi:hypothetical protein